MVERAWSEWYPMESTNVHPGVILAPKLALLAHCRISADLLAGQEPGFPKLIVPAWEPHLRSAEPGEILQNEPWLHLIMSYRYYPSSISLERH